MTCAHKPAKILIVDTTPSEKERASKCKGLLGNYKSEIVVSSWQRRKSVYVCISHNCWIYIHSRGKNVDAEKQRGRKKLIVCGGGPPRREMMMFVYPYNVSCRASSIAPIFFRFLSALCRRFPDGREK
jgi:hypothetical protein